MTLRPTSTSTQPNFELTILRVLDMIIDASFLHRNFEGNSSLEIKRELKFERFKYKIMIKFLKVYKKFTGIKNLSIYIIQQLESNFYVAP